jgi:hypothetical protein
MPLLFFLFAAAAASGPSAAEQTAIFTAAGFKKAGGAWKSGNCNGMESASYEPGRIDTYRDLNGDGRPEAIATEGGGICYGNTGTHFWLLSKQASGGWKLMLEETAVPDFLRTRGVGSWPDVQLGGPGFCFTVVRWNGKAYLQNRFEYEGQRCKP